MTRRAVRRAVRRVVAGLIGMAALAGPAAWAQDSTLPQVHASEPRAYGWRLGDVVTRELSVSLPAGWQLRSDSLPQPRATGRALELRDVQRVQRGGQLQLTLHYQLMRSPAELQTVEIAPLLLQVQGPTRVATLRVEAWPLLVGPLAPAEAPAREGLGELQPDRPPPWPDDRLRPARLAAECTLLLGAALALSRARWGAWWRRGTQRPLALAWRQLAGLRSGASTAAVRRGLQALHGALNQHAGRTLTAAGVAEFCRQRPAFAPLHDELLAFFALSDATFFADAAVPPQAAEQLRAWGRRWRAAERQR